MEAKFFKKLDKLSIEYEFDELGSGLEGPKDVRNMMLMLLSLVHNHNCLLDVLRQENDKFLA